MVLVLIRDRWGCRMRFLTIIGSYQSGARWSECDGADYGWEYGIGYVAGSVVFGVSGWEAYAEGACYDSRREDLRIGGAVGWEEGDGR